MSYSELEGIPSVQHGDCVKVLGIKVGDMNRLGNEVGLHHAELEKMVPRAIAERRCAPPRTIIFPKRGAAIATNKKRISYDWTAFDPNVIGVIAQDAVDQDYLFHWFQGFDLRTITEPGPTPQLNKKNLEPIMIPVPTTLDAREPVRGRRVRLGPFLTTSLNKGKATKNDNRLRRSFPTCWRTRRARPPASIRSGPVILKSLGAMHIQLGQ
jgi:hypothetical protein